MQNTSPINILLVDDRKENLLSLTAVLDSSEYNLICATNGEEALKLTLQIEFAVILLDVDMPIIDGFEVAKLIKQREKSKHIPIIFVTAHGDELEFVTRGYEIGAIDYIVKPFQPENLRSKVESLVSMHRNFQEKLQHQSFDTIRFAGEIAVGIAHEIRNPMTTVFGLLQMFKSSHDRPSDSMIELMLSELNQANMIMSEFLYLAPNKRVDLERKDINQLIRHISPSLKKLAEDHGIVLELNLKDALEVSIDPKEFNMLLLNLSKNGIEAMQPGQKLMIHTYLSPTGEIVLQIRDEGNGIEENVIPHIGTPFFTTKETNKGLGLAVSFSIAKRHNAWINYETGDQGTTFSIRFKPDSDR
ncbi:response regulator [Ammoniphilus sp. CFH 90114]|uniref:response regulator n=1 Tax=Ammoniphilus sp. CFH 90114 TaxID=2493665 RepID=UPI00100E8D41|nr:response regulator [Ammoniphilus sp. CFH 90114]RXT03922.1 hybrid sensor histidine kinase/response regulator [Ammoniphilus sp. CFH 90114]